MILKPSEIAPFDAMIFAEVLDEAGVPAGVFNLVNGDGPTVGVALSSHPDIAMISFTGSTRAGISVAQNAAPSVKRVAQELGGKSANIILEDADIDRTVEAAIWGGFSNAGQTCISVERIFAHEKIYPEITQRLSVEIQKMSSGPKDSEIGSITVGMTLEKIKEQLLNIL